MLEPDDFRTIEKIMDDKLERFAEIVNRGFSAVQLQFGEVNKRIDQTNERIDKLYNHVDGFMRLYTRHDEDILILVRRVNELEKEVKELKEKVGSPT